VLEKYNNSLNQTTLKIISLYRNNYVKPLHLRAIARTINIDVKAVQLQLQTLEKNNILQSTQKGKNKEYTLNLNNHLTKYYLTLAETYHTITYLNENFEIKKIMTEIGNQLGDNVFLFGSFAKHEATPDSDIDLMSVSNTKPDLAAIRQMGSLIGREINVKTVTTENFQQGLTTHDPLIEEVVANHVILKGIDTICEMLWQYYANR
jgi:predicted nucleotidyltransferase